MLPEAFHVQKPEAYGVLRCRSAARPAEHAAACPAWRPIYPPLLAEFPAEHGLADAVRRRGFDPPHAACRRPPTSRFRVDRVRLSFARLAAGMPPITWRFAGALAGSRHAAKMASGVPPRRAGNERWWSYRRARVSPRGPPLFGVCHRCRTVRRPAAGAHGLRPNASLRRDGSAASAGSGHEIDEIQARKCPGQPAAQSPPPIVDAPAPGPATPRMSATPKWVPRRQ